MKPASRERTDSNLHQRKGFKSSILPLAYLAIWPCFQPDRRCLASCPASSYMKEEEAIERFKEHAGKGKDWQELQGTLFLQTQRSSPVQLAQRQMLPAPLGFHVQQQLGASESKYLQWSPKAASLPSPSVSPAFSSHSWRIDNAMRTIWTSTRLLVTWAVVVCSVWWIGSGYSLQGRNMKGWHGAEGPECSFLQPTVTVMEWLLPLAMVRHELSIYPNISLRGRK